MSGLLCFNCNGRSRGSSTADTKSDRPGPAARSSTSGENSSTSENSSTKRESLIEIRSSLSKPLI